ncbi:protein FORGETTER 1-like isoform X1 [Rhododendron vialii]|uniref:protein FORGETTER 1-like isoform X1 n=1 Tax=Rhododendron vialii TaxID=182163 RepID=UPI00265D80F8|nr:protein FORGETTER 1-like isoform X1 [Rhododendron vialii]
MEQPSVPLPPPLYPQQPQPQPPPPPSPAEEINEVAVEVEREESEGGTVGETFTDYRPPKLRIGPCHPDPVVETSSLSAVHPPEPTYDLKIKDELESSGPLSCLQIETLVYASQRHLQHLPDGARAGFFIGDGAGVGKGRTIAGLILENWRHGRRKALWISVGSDLKFDARRDLDDVGATNIEVHALNKLSYSKLDSKSVGVRDGVIFLTYSCLIASTERGRSRLQQLVQWCGTKYDGLVIFDECHKAKNLIPEAGGQPTQTGQAVLELQARLTEARVIYCSATGASEPRNMGYMVRLGLWGAGTCFLDFRDFLGAIQKGGVGALELVAMDMKARGMYVCRTLSYKGAEFEVVEIPLEAKMMGMYNRAAEFWAELRVELLSANALLTVKKPKNDPLWRLYWANHQRFFSHMCMSAKVPAVVRIAKQALIENKCVVIGIQSTGEARTEEAVAKYGLELDGFISGPRELLLKFVEEHYPLPPKPVLLPEESEKNLPRKRHLATPGVSVGGRVTKVAKCKAGSDDESDEEAEVDSEHESTEWEAESDAESDEESESDFESESTDEFQIHDTYSPEELVDSTFLVPPVIDAVSGDVSCHSGQGKQDQYLQARNALLAELVKRYEGAVERKSKLLDVIRSLELPDNPLDDIIDQLGGPCNVAEITGRRGMLVRTSDGKGVTYLARNTKEVPMDMVNMNEKQLFMDGKKLVAIISEAGSAGVSLQADRRAINQKRRVHLTLELPWSADRAIQQFGRTHRSNQASAPEYRLLFTNLGGERRFASIVAKRLESLGALTQGDRRAGPSLSAYNYDSAYGKRALMMMYSGIMEQDPLPVLPLGCSAENPGAIQDFIVKAKAALFSVAIVRENIRGNGTGSGIFSSHIADSDMHDVGRFLNRILGLPPDIQNGLFELFVSIFDLVIQKARLEGYFDSGIVKMRANTIELRGNPKVVYEDPLSGASTLLFTFTLDRGTTWKSASALLDEKQKDGSDLTNIGFYESRNEWMGRRHFLLAIKGSASGLYKIFRPATGDTLSREMLLTELKEKYVKVSYLEKARSGWEAEYEVSSKQVLLMAYICLYLQCMHGPNCKLGNFCTVGRRLQEVNVLGGLILQIWGSIEKVISKQAHQSHKRLRVVRIETTTDNQQIVGLLIPNAAVASVLQGVQDAGD